MTIEQIAVNRWIVTVQEDKDTGELYLPLNEDMLSATGWTEGDTLTWEVTTNESGTCVVLSKSSSGE